MRKVILAVAALALLAGCGGADGTEAPADSGTEKAAPAPKEKPADKRKPHVDGQDVFAWIDENYSDPQPVRSVKVVDGGAMSVELKPEDVDWFDSPGAAGFAGCGMTRNYFDEKGLDQPEILVWAEGHPALASAPAGGKCSFG
ncbi:hypothetical protein ABN034_12455 [Actinopolymorpha sp. B11F2]|uniref:hypothetical protein n=1 Tax=Actinopolymorpha sp. B11F2 TaxID=3160862 RepID=UPI0032E3FB54